MKISFIKRSNITIVAVMVMILACSGCGGKEEKKPLTDWQIREFVHYTNVPEIKHLDRLNFTNWRNKFAIMSNGYQINNDESAPKLYREKSFSSSVFMALKNADLVTHKGVSGNVTVKKGQWLLIWFPSDFTTNNYPAKAHMTVGSDGQFTRDFSDFDCIEEGGKIFF
jgi:hypothetical protein